MAELAAKNKRSQALSNFTRTHNIIEPLLANTDSPSVLVNSQFLKLQETWAKLEEAQDRYIELVTDFDVETDANGIAYLNDAGERYTNALHAYAEYLKKVAVKESLEKKKEAASSKFEGEQRLKTEAQERKVADELLKTAELDAQFESSKARLVSIMTAFKDTNVDLQDTLAEASDSDKRRELDRLESDFKGLQEELISFSSIDTSKNIDTEKEQFKTDVQTIFNTNQKWLLAQLKESSSNTSGGSSGSIDSSGSSSVVASSMNTSRKETIHLPHFYGDETAQPFLQFPTWKKRWDLHITDYDEKHHAGLLLDHLDDTAKTKFIGWEMDY